MKRFTVEVGDRVAYSAQWLRSTGQIASADDIGGARGRVTEKREVCPGLVLATVEWERGDFPPQVNVANLAKVGPNPRFCHCG